MRRKNLFLISIAVFLLIPTVTQANGFYHGYIGIDSSQLSLDDRIGSEIEPDNIRFRIGGHLERGVDLEAHFGLTFDADRALEADWSADFASLFLKGHLPIGRFLSLYGMIGGSAISVTERVDRRDFVDELYGFSWGAGIEAVLTDRVDLSLDYVTYLHDDEIFDDISAWSFGFKFYY